MKEAQVWGGGVCVGNRGAGGETRTKILLKKWGGAGGQESGDRLEQVTRLEKSEWWGCIHSTLSSIHKVPRTEEGFQQQKDW